METSVADPASTAWLSDGTGRNNHLGGTEPATEPFEPPEALPTFTWTGLPPQVLATVLDPHSSPEGVRLAMGTAVYIQQQMMVHKSKVALLGLRAMADMAGIHKDTVSKAVAQQQTVVRVSTGTALVIEEGHGDPSQWALVAMDDPQPITVPLDPNNWYDVDARLITAFFDPVHERWSTKKGGMTSRSYWLVLALLITHGVTRVTVTTPEAAALVGIDGSTARRTLADIVGNLHGDAKRTSNGLEIDLCQMLAMDWGGNSDREKEAARKAERAKWLDWRAISDARRYRESILSLPDMTPEVLAWVETHPDEVLANFRKAYERNDEATTIEVTVTEPTHVDPAVLQALRDKVRGLGQPTSPPSTKGWVRSSTGGWIDSSQP